MDIIELLKAVVIGIVEGITEWLPISSTGHMILADEFIKLNVSPRFMELFLVVIQLGAIMAVLLLYWHRLNPFSPRKDAGERRSTLRLWAKVLVACIPAAIVGFLLDDWMEAHVYNALTVSIALVVYGVAFIVIEHLHADKPGRKQAVGRHGRQSERPSVSSTTSVDALSFPRAIGIGAFQCLAIVPGTSRSGSTILGGLILGVSREAAAEFSFFLAIPVMFGWSLLKALKILVLDSLVMTATEIGVLVTGIIIAFVVSIAAIKFLMGYIKNHSFAAFGWYRIILGVIVIAFFALTGQLL
jgi:undecaprenyl-diphosphatase